MACLLVMPMGIGAQEKNDSKYLAGAVPEVEGRVVFSKEYHVPGMSKEEIFNRALNWMQTRLAKQQNNSRVVLQEMEKGQIVGLDDEWIVFSSTALSLDRTRILCQLFVKCDEEKCRLEVTKMSFVYREGKEKYRAEEWIVDKYALNKRQDKLVLGLAKWRRKTVDFVDELCLDLAEGLSTASVAPQQQVAEAAPTEKVPEKSVANSGTMTIVQKNAVSVSTPEQAQTVQPTTGVQTTQTAKAVQPAQGVLPAQGVQTTQTAKAGQPAQGVQPAHGVQPAQTVQPAQKAPLPAGKVLNPAEGKLVIVIGEEPFNMTMMTANQGGSLGVVKGKQVVFTILSPDQPYEQMERAETYEVRFYPNGSKEPSLTFRCRKMEAPAAIEGMPRTYIGEILK